MRQSGHSIPSLYRNTSRGWPLTKGSLGRLISRGVISVCEPFRDRLRAAARDFLWGLKGELVLGILGDVGEGKAEFGFEAA